MTLKERLEKQLEVLERAQDAAWTDYDYGAIAKLSEQIMAVAVCIIEEF